MNIAWLYTNVSVFPWTFLGRKKRKRTLPAQIVHDSTVKIKDSMKACRLDILQMLSGNYSSNFFQLKIPTSVIIQKRANGHFDMVMLGNDVIQRSMELHNREYRVTHLDNINLICKFEIIDIKYRKGKVVV